MNDGDTDANGADVAGVALPPPLLFGGALALGLFAERLPGAAVNGRRVARVLGTASLAAGGLIGGAALATFKRAGTTVNVYKPSTALATSGVFRFTRNPFYVGMTAVYIGIAMRSRSIPALVLLPVVLALLDSGVVDREERYLERRFGAEYAAYRTRTPRWF